MSHLTGKLPEDDGEGERFEGFESEEERETPPPDPPKWTKPSDVKMLDLPVTLPTLKIVTVHVPECMTELEFDAMVGTINSWKSSLVKTSTSEDSPEDSTADNPPS